MSYGRGDVYLDEYGELDESAYGFFGYRKRRFIIHPLLALLCVGTGGLVSQRAFVKRYVDQSYTAAVVCAVGEIAAVDNLTYDETVGPTKRIGIRCLKGNIVYDAERILDASYVAPRYPSIDLKQTPIAYVGAELSTVTIGYRDYDDTLGFIPPQLLQASDKSPRPSIAVGGDQDNDMTVLYVDIDRQAIALK